MNMNIRSQMAIHSAKRIEKKKKATHNDSMTKHFVYACVCRVYKLHDRKMIYSLLKRDNILRFEWIYDG